MFFCKIKFPVSSAFFLELNNCNFNEILNGLSLHYIEILIEKIDEHMIYCIVVKNFTRAPPNMCNN